MGKTVCITGAAGFIGGALCIEFKKRGYKVVGVDTIYRTYLMKYIDTFYHRDYSTALPRLSRNTECVIHCAGTSLVGPSNTEPALYYQNNVAKTIKLLDWCRNADIPIIFSSSASVYRTYALPIEEDHPKDPQSVYAKSKWMVEQIISDYVSAYNLKATIFRYFNVCGSVSDIHGQAPGATHIFARLFEENSNFTLNGNDFPTSDGTCVRDYIHVQDLVKAHVLAIENKITGVYNLGSNHGYSNKQILEAFGLDYYNVGPRRQGDVPSLIASNTHAKEKLNWEPTHSLQDMINDLRKWYISSTYKRLLRQ